MRIVIVTEGDAEFVALPPVVPQLEGRCGGTIVRLLKAALPPNAPAATIARACRGAIDTARGLRADLVVVVLDREQSQECCGVHARAIEESLARVASPGVTCRVVLKDRMFENWLVADVEALRQQRSRFAVSAALERAVQQGRADSVDALSLLKRSVQRGQYEKVSDARKIMKWWNLDRAEQNSRSMRRLLAVLGDPAYATQSRFAQPPESGAR